MVSSLSCKVFLDAGGLDQHPLWNLVYCLFKILQDNELNKMFISRTFGFIKENILRKCYLFDKRFREKVVILPIKCISGTINKQAREIIENFTKRQKTQAQFLIPHMVI